MNGVDVLAGLIEFQDSHDSHMSELKLVDSGFTFVSTRCLLVTIEILEMRGVLRSIR